MPDDLFLGIDGGQSHTEAVVADARGTILGCGRGGPSNHADEPGGRERLRLAVTDSVSEALRAAAMPRLSEINFMSVHCAMTGGADFKEEVIRSLVHSRHLAVDHDAPAALAGATACQPGIIVMAGTGSAAYGENAKGSCARAGGWGYLFGDEGGGFGIALQAVRRATQVQDGLSDTTPLLRLALEYFKVNDLRYLIHDIYSGQLKRDHFAAFAQAVQSAALSGVVEARRIIQEGTASLAALAAAVARNLKWTEESLHLFVAGGMFRGIFFLQSFEAALKDILPSALICTARFEPVLGALLLAYRGAGTCPDERILSNLERQWRTGEKQ